VFISCFLLKFRLTDFGGRITSRSASAAYKAAMRSQPAGFCTYCCSAEKYRTESGVRQVG